MGSTSKERAFGSSLYDQLYTRHVDCADHLCNDESSNVDSTSSTDDSYESACSDAGYDYFGDELTPISSRTETLSYTTSIHSEPPSPSGAVTNSYRSNFHGASSDDDISDEDTFNELFFKDPLKKARKSWGESVFKALGVYSKANKLVGKREKPLKKKEIKGNSKSDPWDDFANPQHGAKGQHIITGSVSGSEPMHIALQKRGFYTIFVRSKRGVEKNRQGVNVFKVKLTYKVFDFKRNKIQLKPSGGNFIPHDVLGDDNFSLANEGAITIAAKDTKILFIYAATDSIAEFSIIHSMLNTQPAVLYRIVYGGWCSAVPLSLTPKLRLRILSIDSCENLGTSALATLYAIEQRLSSMQGVNSNIANHFDLICASGTGAIIALCLLKGYSARELRVQWQSILEQLFKWRHSKAYGLMFDHENVDQFVRSWMEILGTDFMCSRPRPLCALTATNVKGPKYEMFVFRNYTNVHAPYGKTAFAPMWLAGWASNALPTYMKGPSDRYLKGMGCIVDREVHFVNGKYISSNPSMVALREASELYGSPLRTIIDETVDVFLSVGTSSKKDVNKKTDDPTPWQIILSSNDSITTQIEHGHMQYLFEERPDVYHRIEMPSIRGCTLGKTSKKDVDDVFNSALELTRSHMENQISEIARVIST
ncbi:phospholipase [Babesia ovis]|uniref:Phospholipase n=1 Tax=Babesia ovis TaxID=5869 RepID=A0A9W5WVM8_BABOV|nr:phospholipase [Babesia ovis]